MRMIDIGMLPGGLTSTAYSINDSAQVVGESQTSTTTHAFFFQDANNNGAVDAGELRDLDTVNSSQSGARSINNRGVAVGYFSGCSAGLALLNSLPRKPGSFLSGLGGT